jgi:hypothetical protein
MTLSRVAEVAAASVVAEAFMAAECEPEGFTAAASGAVLARAIPLQAAQGVPDIRLPVALVVRAIGPSPVTLDATIHIAVTGRLR